MKIKLILLLFIPLFITISCNDSDRERLRKKSLHFFLSDITGNMYDVKSNDIESRMHQKILYFFPRLKGKPTDVHLRVNIGYDSSCTIYFYQGDPMKVDYYYPRLIKEKRLKPRNSNIKPYKTTYQEQIEILHYHAFLCEKMGVENFGCVVFRYEDSGELSVDITELCDSIKNIKSDDEEGIFPLAMEKTAMAKDLKNIFDNHDIEFVDYLLYYMEKIPYNQYAIQHQLKKKHNTPHVYPIHNFLVRLHKNTLEYKIKSNYKNLMCDITEQLGLSR
jgi:hypothetical protein